MSSEHPSLLISPLYIKLAYLSKQAYKFKVYDPKGGKILSLCNWCVKSLRNPDWPAWVTCTQGGKTGGSRARDWHSYQDHTEEPTLPPGQARDHYQEGRTHGCTPPSAGCFVLQRQHRAWYILAAQWMFVAWIMNKHLADHYLVKQGHPGVWNCLMLSLEILPQAFARTLTKTFGSSWQRQMGMLMSKTLSFPRSQSWTFLRLSEPLPGDELA